MIQISRGRAPGDTSVAHRRRQMTESSRRLPRPCPPDHWPEARRLRDRCAALDASISASFSPTQRTCAADKTMESRPRPARFTGFTNPIELGRRLLEAIERHVELLGESRGQLRGTDLPAPADQHRWSGSLDRLGQSRTIRSLDSACPGNEKDLAKRRLPETRDDRQLFAESFETLPQATESRCRRRRARVANHPVPMPSSPDRRSSRRPGRPRSPMDPAVERSPRSSTCLGGWSWSRAPIRRG